MLTYYFIRFLEKDTSVLPFLLCIKSCNEFPKNPEKMHYCYKTLLVWYWVFLQVDLVFSEWVEIFGNPPVIVYYTTTAAAFPSGEASLAASFSITAVHNVR